MSLLAIVTSVLTQAFEVGKTRLQPTEGRDPDHEGR